MNKLLETLSILLVLSTIVLAYYFYQILPDQIITHWNAQGVADDWGSKTTHVILIPAITIGMYLLFKLLPKIDPKKLNYSQFSTAYKGLQVLLIAFFTGMFIITSLVNLSYNIPIGTVVSAIIGVLFIIIGIFMPKFKPNWFVGIKTPWTLSSEIVWKKTHKFGGYTFALAGVLFLLITFLPDYLYPYMFGLAILLALSSTIYSYFVYRNLKEEDNLENRQE